jgi:hypothetical protein
VLFHVTWTVHSPTAEGADESRELFTKWQPPEGVEFKGFFGNIDGSGGVAIIESDDAHALAATVSPWLPWLSFTVTPVMPIEEGVAIGAEAAAWRASVS